MADSLFNTVIQATGLPEDSVEKELRALIAQHGKSPQDLTLDDLREILADYLQTIILESQDKLSS
jgi:plasmid stability protein